MKRHRIMIIGNNIATVQKLSRYCLTQGAEVFPYYGVPTIEEIALFEPEVAIVCLPIFEGFLHQIARPYIVWSEENAIALEYPFTNTISQLQVYLQQVFAS
jgi:hypothetical protein